MLISHNLPVVARLCDRIGVLYAGRLVEEGPADAVLQRPRQPYTESLVRCLPDGVRRKRDGALQTIPGQLPPPGAAIPGCVFAPRCFAVEAKCHVEAPPARNTAGHRALCHFDPPFRATGAVPDADMAPWPGSSAPASGSSLRAVRLSKTYRGAGGPIRVVRDVSFDLAAGETLGLVGESGSGKTTLARLMLGLAVPDAGGHFEIGGHTVAPSLTARTLADRKAIQIVFQNPDSALNRAQKRTAHPDAAVAQTGTPLTRACRVQAGGPRQRRAIAACALGDAARQPFRRIEATGGHCAGVCRRPAHGGLR